MASPERRPSADDVDRLVEQVRRDPGSRAFVALGEAYLALGKAREAVEVGVAGLRAPRPDAEHDGRVMMARGLAALHQWKEAQAELLKVVKVDRNHRVGFSLLGEVLMRRGDFERALPVLQHAQNLDPSNPAVLSMLRKARAGQPLDPPPAVPTPMEPLRSKRISAAPPPPAPRAAPPPPARRVAPIEMDDGPTAVGDTLATRELPSLRGDPTDVTMPQEDASGEITDEPTRSAPMSGSPRRPPPRAPAPAPAEKLRKGRPSAPPPMNQMAAAAAASRSPAPAPADPMVRPRVIGGAKPANPAAEALRQSAAAGENYLNDLLTGGLLEVPGVRVPDSEFDIKPDRRWGRSGGRMITALFILVILGSAGGVTWWYYADKERKADISRRRASADELILSGAFGDLERAKHELTGALELDRRSAVLMAEIAEVNALEVLLYDLPMDAAHIAITAGERDIDKPTEEGWRELVIARAALALGTLSADPDKVAARKGARADEALARARDEIETYLAEHSDDRWAIWLQGRMMLAAGERKVGRMTLTKATEGEEGIVPAIIDLADLLVDDGELAEADKLYARALTAAPEHPLALLGQALLSTERGTGDDQLRGLDSVTHALSDKKNLGPRVRAYRDLILAQGNYQIEEYEAAATALATAGKGPEEARFLGRIALAHLLAGDVQAAMDARGRVAWFGKGTPEGDPVISLFEAGVLVESGLSRRGLDRIGETQSVRGRLIRAQAHLDLATAGAKIDEAEAGRALTEAEAVIAIEPDPSKQGSALIEEALALRALAKVLLENGKEKRLALINSELNPAAGRLESQRGRHAEGAALFAVGAAGDAHKKLEKALDDATPGEPNPIKYRTHTLLALLDLEAKDLAAAEKHADDALAANPGYRPAMAAKARVLRAKNDLEGAGAALALLVDEPDLMTADLELLDAELRMSRGDTAGAAEALQRALDKGAPAAEVGRIAALVDAALPARLGVPAPAGAEPPADDGAKKKDDGGGKKKKRKRRG